MNNNELNLSQEPKYGFLLFDENIDSKENIMNNKMSGIGCYPSFIDSKLTFETFTFNKIKELKKDIIWYSNLVKENVWRSGNWNIKSKNYLGISYEALYSNIITAKTKDKQQIAIIFAQLFNSVMFAYEKFIRDNNLEFKIGKNELYEDVYNLFMLKSFNPNTEDKMRFKFSEAYIEKIKMPKNKELQNNNLIKEFTFLVESEKYIDFILEEMMPVGKWQEVENKNETIASLKEKIKINANFKYFIKIDNLKLNPTFTKINLASLWLGTRGFLLNGTVIDEIWLTEKEFLFLSNYAEFSILEIYCNQDTKKIKDYFFKKIYKKELLLNEQEDIKIISMTFHILNMLFFKSFISKGYMPENRKKFLFSENMIWFRAKEREYLFNIVKELVEKFDCDIKEYGNGEITIYLDKQIDKQNLVLFLLKNNLFVPSALSLEMIENKEEFKNENSIVLKDFKIKNKYLTKDIKENYINFINRLSYTYKKNKEEVEDLMNILSKMKFSKNDEEDKEYQWFLLSLQKSILLKK